MGRMGKTARTERRSRVLISIRTPVAVAYCLGTLDRGVVQDLGARVRALLFEDVRGFLCSLERVEHIHFQALEPLVDLHRFVAEAGGRFLLAGASPYLKQILDFGGVPGRIELVPDTLAALHELRGNPPLGVLAAASVQQSLL